MPDLLSQRDQINSCAFDGIHKGLLKKDYEYREKNEEYEKAYIRYQKEDLTHRDNPEYTLPVVVHIIHNGGAENISDDDVRKGIDNLNDAYANLGYYDQNTGVVTGIQFCLAQQTPEGDPSKGINRIQSPLTEVDGETQDLDLKNLIRWDPLHYINIWVVKEICMGSKCSVVGYAYFPAMHGKSHDGLVVEAAYFAGTKSSSVVQVHELGHYLGLYHTFQGGCDNYDCKINGDKICDTPPDNSTFKVKCGEDFNSCQTDAQSGFSTDQNDMYWNYMDYGDFKCYSAFTEGQRRRMIFTIEQIRASLLDSKACISPCPTDISASFTTSKDTFVIGESTTFTNNSTNNATVFSWEKNGTVISVDKDLKYRFIEVGSHIFTLKVYNSDKTCYDYINKEIVVICKARANITADKIEIQSGETINFNSPSSGIDSYKWIINNDILSTIQQFSHTFYEEGVYTVMLIATNDEWNCSDTSLIDIKVICPVNANFATSSYFPLINTDVLFTNKSINATQYEWTVDGVNISNSQNLNYSFNSAGEYTVCLTSGNGNCEKKFCMQIFVVDGETNDCEDVYYKRIGDPNIDETCRDFEFLSNGTIAVVGSHNNNSIVFNINKTLKVISSNIYDFLQGDEYIYNTFLDKDGFLLMSGIEINTSSNGRGAFLLKYDIANKQVIWNKVIIDTKKNFPIFWTLSQLPNGNYLCGGKTYGNGCDALIAEITNHTGDILWKKTFDTGSCEGFLKAMYIDGYIYATGRFAINSSSENKFRGVVVKMNSKGEEIWSKNYIFPVSGSSRIYPFDMVQDNGLVIAILGDETGSDLDNIKMQIIKINYEGDLLWAKGFYINNTLHNRAEKILNLPDGYLIGGDYIYSNKNRNQLVYKIDKSGKLIWAKSYQLGTSTNLNSMKIKNGYLYCMGTVTNINDKDMYILKLKLDGSLPIDCSIDVVDPGLMEKAFNFFSEPIKIKDLSNNMPYENRSFTEQNINLIENNICKKDCVDTCLLAPDASMIISDAQCKQDSFIINFEICNQGNYAIPINTPVSFYSQNPLTKKSKLIGIFYIPDSIPKDVCRDYFYTIKSLGDITIYGFVNDNGTLKTPYLPDVEMPNTGILECNWDNNLGFLELREAKSKILDLGNDTTMCISGIVNLNAGGGFESYLWNDGSTDSIFTAWNPGKYWVEVIDMCGNTQIDSIEIIVDPATKIDLGEDLSICKGETIEFEVNGFVNYQWQPQKVFDCNSCNKVTVKPEEEVKIIVVASDENGCYSTDTLDITVFNTGNIHLPEDTTIYLGDKIKIIPQFPDSSKYKYSWTPDEGLSCVDCYSPEAFPLKTTKYTLQVSDENGCSSTDDIIIEVKKNITITISNIFTPNSDGKNDYFYIQGKAKGIKEVSSFKIFDRWGELVFENGHFRINDPLYGWDGRFKGQRVNPGVYVYAAVIELLDNTTVKYSGDITVIR